MPRSTLRNEGWKRMVLRSLPPPAWLTGDAPDRDIAISSRVRYARNLVGERFVHHADADALRAIADRIETAVEASGLGLQRHRRLSPAEQEYWIGTRLISPEFQTGLPGRVLYLDADQSVSLMVNEEDHLRLQAVTGGWSAHAALRLADFVLERLARHLSWAEAAPWGILTASPMNAGQGVRISSMFHLIGLAHTRRLTGVLRALGAHQVMARGLFGESSRAIGAFIQVSVTHGRVAELSGAAEVILQEERRARAHVGGDELQARVAEATDYAVGQSELSLADALRVAAWVRWAAAAGLDGYPFDARTVDDWLARLEVRPAAEPAVAARDRAAALRGFLNR